MPYYVWTVLAQWPAADRALRCVAYGAVFAFSDGLPFAMEYSANFTAYNGDIKETPAPSKLQLKAVDIQGISEDLFEVR